MLNTLGAYLLAVARAELARDLAGKVAASDIVQETLMEAHQAIGQFRGRTREEFLSWLMSILQHNVLNAARRYRETAGRDVAREVHLPADAALDAGFGLVDPSPGPGSVVCASEDEQRLLARLGRLPEVYRQVIELHNREHLTFGEVGERIGRSAEAARKLWVRALERLKDELKA